MNADDHLLPEHKMAITTPCDTCSQFGSTQRGGMLFISYKQGTRGFDSGLRAQYKKKVYVRLLGRSQNGRYGHLTLTLTPTLILITLAQPLP